MNSFKFSIVVPVYNAEQSIDKCIISVINQTYGNFELILVNDGSVDSSLEKCQNYLYDDRVNIIDKANGGVSSARNAGINRATGEYILFLDSDDYLDENILKTYDSLLKEYDADIIISLLNKIGNDSNDKNNIVLDTLQEGFKDISVIGNEFGYWYKNGLLNAPVSKCYKKSMIKTLFDNNISLGEDLIFVLNYLINCSNIYLCKKTLYNYILSNDNTLSSKYHINGFDMLDKVLDDTVKLSKNIWGESLDLSEVYIKYICDYCTMAERLVNFEDFNYTQKLYILNENINILKKEELLKNIKYSRFNIKIIIPFFLLKNRLFKVMYIYVNLKNHIKHIIRYVKAR